MPEEYPAGLVAAAACLGLVIICAIGILVQWFRMRAAPDGPEDPAPAEMPFQAQELPPLEPSVREMLQRVEDILAAKLGHQTEIALEAESRIKSELVEQGCKIDILADALRQNNKELAVVEQLLRDVIQILNISISETKGLSQKVQNHIEDPLRVAQALAQRSHGLR